MKKIALVSALIASVLATAVSASANTYVDPRAPLDGHTFFRSLPTGQ